MGKPEERQGRRKKADTAEAAKRVEEILRIRLERGTVP